MFAVSLPVSAISAAKAFLSKSHVFLRGENLNVDRRGMGNSQETNVKTQKQESSQVCARIKMSVCLNTEAETERGKQLVAC